MDLKNKVVLITGSSSGIGRTTAIRFAQEGAKVVVNYHINEAGGQETLAEVEKYSEGLLIKADISRPEEVKKLFEEVVQKFGTVDILVNNAATYETVIFKDLNEEQILDVINTNMVGTFLCSQKVLEIMQKNQSGKILNTTSIKGQENCGGNLVVFASTKAAINSFTKTLAKQVAPNIQVNAVAPGYVKTRTYDNMDDSKIEKYLSQTYLKRWITEDEVADTFIFLAKNDAMTGQVIYVDAGFTLK